MSATLLNKDYITIQDENGNIIARIKPTMTSSGVTMDKKKFLIIRGKELL